MDENKKAAQKKKISHFITIAVLVILFLAFILYMIRSAQTSREKNVEPGVEEEEYLLEAEEIQEMSMGKSVIYILLGAVAIAVGSDWVVDGACTCLLYTSPSPRDA